MSIDPTILAIAHEAWHANYTGDLPTHDALIAAVEAITPHIAAQAKADALRAFADAHRMPFTLFNHDGQRVTISDLLREQAAAIEANADFLAKAIADPEGQQLATAAAGLAPTWGKEWAVSVRSRPNDVGEASSDPADRDEMLTQIAEWNSRHDAGAYLVARTVSPWKEERRVTP